MSKNVVAEYEKFSAGDLTLKKKAHVFRALLYHLAPPTMSILCPPTWAALCT